MASSSRASLAARWIATALVLGLGACGGGGGEEGGESPVAGTPGTDPGPGPAPQPGPPPPAPQPSPPAPAPGVAKTFFIAPAGSDSNAGTSAAAPFRTFSKAFAAMQAGDELVLLDGSYTSATSGTMGDPPSGSTTRDTLLRAQNPGAARINGSLNLGSSSRKVSRVKIQGLTFSGGASLHNTSFITVKDTGFQGAVSIGTNDHSQGNTDNLMEDVWIRAAGERLIVQNYRADRNVWRRVVLRGDGCGTSRCSGSGNPNVGITVYESVDVSLQNVIVVDRILAPTDAGYADFAVAAHSSTLKTGRAEWLGVMSLNAPDQGFNMDPDGTNTTVSPTLTLRNAVVWNPADYGGYFAKGIQDGVWDSWTIANTGSRGITVDSQTLRSTMRNMLVYRTRDFGIKFPSNAPGNPDFVNTFDTDRAFEQNSKTCTTGCYNLDPSASQRFLTRIEPGSPLKGAGQGGGDIGANVEFRYGVDGTRFGEPGYNTLTRTALWPWPNEARIKQDLCTSINVTRGFCSTGKRLDGVRPVTFSSYVWELLGNPAPAEVAP